MSWANVFGKAIDVFVNHFIDHGNKWVSLISILITSVGLLYCRHFCLFKIDYINFPLLFVVIFVLSFLLLSLFLLILNMGWKVVSGVYAKHIGFKIISASTVVTNNTIDYLKIEMKAHITACISSLSILVNGNLLSVIAYPSRPLAYSDRNTQFTSMESGRTYTIWIPVNAVNDMKDHFANAYFLMKTANGKEYKHKMFEN